MNSFEYRRPRILDQISLDQHAVIEASAGTGKTFTIENIVVEILFEEKATLDQILVVTFTERATSELRKRIRGSLESVLSGKSINDAPPEERRRLPASSRRIIEDALFAFDRAPIHTIHSFCHRTLSELAFQSGMRFGIELTDAQSSLHEAFRAELREHFAVDPAAKKLSDEWLANKTVANLEEMLVAAYRKRYLASVDHRSAMSAGKRASFPLEVRVAEAFLPRVAARMERMKRERGVIDYDDMLQWLADSLEQRPGADLIASLRARYRYALIDEFQDTDDLQWQIFRKVFIDGGAGTVAHLIGDPKQAIYSFRGADVHSYLDARRELEEQKIAPIRLVENFRSTARLIEATNLIFRQNVSAPFFSGNIRYDAPVTCGRKNLRAVDARLQDVKPVSMLKLVTSEKISAQRARLAIGRRIARILREMLAPNSRRLRVAEDSGAPRQIQAGSVYILTRTNAESIMIGRLLADARVPYAFYKQEGLFETRVAGDILDALKAAQEPNVRSRRLKAWTTPFFAVPVADLPRLADPPPGHVLLERLYEWKSLADKEQFAQLFDAMLHRSGLVDRELLLRESERDLTDYLHIFEILLEKAVARRLALGELIELLENYIAKRALPGDEDSDVKRLESERQAVQIMTVHRSKGLEADVVFLFGGTSNSSNRDPVGVFHDQSGRRVAVCKPIKGEEGYDELKREEKEEDERLLYVALTRARLKLYLPFFPEGSLKKFDGYYRHLNDRLDVLIQNDRNKTVADLFEIEEVGESSSGGDDTIAKVRSALKDWNPPPELLDESHDHDGEHHFAEIRERHAPLEVRSYTAIKAALEAAERARKKNSAEDIEADDFKNGVDSIDEDGSIADLRGGREVGIFLHGVIEKLDLATFGDDPDEKLWAARADVRELFASTMRRHGVRDARWLERGREIVFRTMTSPVAMGDAILARGFCATNGVREMEFTYPIPEAHHRLLAGNGGGEWRAERGYLKGFVDYIFQHDCKTYFADWKSDLLASYEADAVAAHVQAHYSLQAQIYSVGVVRMLGIQNESDYRDRFGGLLYVFLRGVGLNGDANSGIYFARPEWTEIVNYESSLIAIPADPGIAQ
ncbi:MAG: UvrD-helicase domain-containing protein [Candidatus Binatus sp.]|uniref:UvrD-helicase domain-containing protein n=1 Tax=Candidatus Binatus sp. TaxID=2811406 RepID=UPI00271E5B04|nr:UvrD-helicase domain-containing protein [Candidatus Binatus sp.]MDO8431518.1 UvrD-helicase domain-containing protein [Candidatus Binatus sp.]